MNHITSNYFKSFQNNISSIEKPSIFNYPFVVDVHPLCELAIAELKEYLQTTNDFFHDFGIDNPSNQSIGKMFGVLVVENNDGKIGYLSAYSGKLANSNHVSFFVPPVFDMLTDGSFFLEEEKVLNKLNAQLLAIENNESYKNILDSLSQLHLERNQVISDKKEENKQLKKDRKLLREVNKTVLSDDDYIIFEEDLIKQSLRDKHELNVITKLYDQKIDDLNQQKAIIENDIEVLKETRKSKSNALQKRLFEAYSFLNAKNESKNLLDIFEENLHIQPPAGAGECCAPKLLQFAYLNELKPLALAEFWWGMSPKSEIKKHEQVYPSCWGKCQPILSHMLNGLQVKESPFLNNPAEGKDIEIVYDDPYMVIVNKPAEFLSVPGIHITDSVYERIKLRYPHATGPLIVHRLDMSTSGLMVLAKSKEVHKIIQEQFIKHTIQKRYVAVLEGVVKLEKGIVDLPLRVDLDDRPKQVVCYEYGKKAVTKFEVVEIKDNETRIHYWPITGRTHQLRMHSAHYLGLNSPIKGDDLYGNQSDRLYLHAEELVLKHPISKEEMTFIAKAPF